MIASAAVSAVEAAPPADDSAAIAAESAAREEVAALLRRIGSERAEALAGVELTEQRSADLFGGLDADSAPAAAEAPPPDPAAEVPPAAPPAAPQDPPAPAPAPAGSPEGGAAPEGPAAGDKRPQAGRSVPLLQEQIRRRSSTEQRPAAAPSAPASVVQLAAPAPVDAAYAGFRVPLRPRQQQQQPPPQQQPLRPGAAAKPVNVLRRRPAPPPGAAQRPDAGTGASPPAPADPEADAPPPLKGEADQPAAFYDAAGAVDTFEVRASSCAELLAAQPESMTYDASLILAERLRLPAPFSGCWDTQDSARRAIALMQEQVRRQRAEERPRPLSPSKPLATGVAAQVVAEAKQAGVSLTYRDLQQALDEYDTAAQTEKWRGEAGYIPLPAEEAAAAAVSQAAPAAEDRGGTKADAAAEEQRRRDWEAAVKRRQQREIRDMLDDINADLRRYIGMDLSSGRLRDCPAGRPLDHDAASEEDQPPQRPPEGAQDSPAPSSPGGSDGSEAADAAEVLQQLVPEAQGDAEHLPLGEADHPFEGREELEPPQTPPQLRHAPAAERERWKREERERRTRQRRAEAAAAEQDRSRRAHQEELSARAKERDEKLGRQRQRAAAAAAEQRQRAAEAAPQRRPSLRARAGSGSGAAAANMLQQRPRGKQPAAVVPVADAAA
eukprot:TRINITY_DN10710_c2_g1_i1.p1 TRINITY_DN10710_c2_g1~~TRINITY_DN10710_c2_g1_i1.p1  ORF type:complete len:691 (+),score=217.17 TRINITY_DN10710_c2_g1_i1:74-2074(+)